MALNEFMRTETMKCQGGDVDIGSPPSFDPETPLARMDPWASLSARGAAVALVRSTHSKICPKSALQEPSAVKRTPTAKSAPAFLYSLFSKGWDIYNSNGDQRISLSNIERKIIESDAFVFTPGATLEDLFKAVSVFVGYQTLDVNLSGKPTVLLNSDGSWDRLFALLTHLNGLGTVKQNHKDYLLLAESPEEVLQLLESSRRDGIPSVGREKIGTNTVDSFETPLPADHEGSVCVFCSASIEDPAYLRDGYEFGKQLAQNRLGCVSGAGNSGIMGEVVRGSVDAGGWTGGSNVPHIIELEGLPVGLSSFWLKPDIYTRMEIMIQQFGRVRHFSRRLRHRAGNARADDFQTPGPSVDDRQAGDHLQPQGRERRILLDAAHRNARHLVLRRRVQRGRRIERFDPDGPETRGRHPGSPWRRMTLPGSVLASRRNDALAVPS